MADMESWTPVSCGLVSNSLRGEWITGNLETWRVLMQVDASFPAFQLSSFPAPRARGGNLDG